MPASLPGATPAQNQGNPTQGACVTFDLLSGPKGSPFDKDSATPVQNTSTGALSTGIGFGSPPVIGNITLAGFTDDYTPGVTKPDGTASANSTLMYIGGGRSTATGVSNPYVTGFGIGMAGQGGARESGALGFPIKLVTAVGAVANGAVVETGWANRSGVALIAGQSVFGVSATAAVAPTMELAEADEEPKPRARSSKTPPPASASLNLSDSADGMR